MKAEQVLPLPFGVLDTSHRKASCSFSSFPGPSESTLYYPEGCRHFFLVFAWFIL